MYKMVNNLICKYDLTYKMYYTIYKPTFGTENSI
jgi:hypothetical protein